MNKNILRPVVVTVKEKKLNGFFHRFVFKQANNQSDTLVLVELDNGKLRFYDPFFVQFSDRKKESDKPKKESS